jgi:hypothetical protein
VQSDSQLGCIDWHKTCNLDQLIKKSSHTQDSCTFESHCLVITFSIIKRLIYLDTRSQQTISRNQAGASSWRLQFITSTTANEADTWHDGCIIQSVLILNSTIWRINGLLGHVLEMHKGTTYWAGCFSLARQHLYVACYDCRVTLPGWMIVANE